MALYLSHNILCSHTKELLERYLATQGQGRPASISCKILLFTQLHCWIHLMGKHGNITHFQQLFFHLIARQYWFLVYFTKYSQFFNFVILPCWSIFNQNYYTMTLNVVLPNIYYEISTQYLVRHYLQVTLEGLQVQVSLCHPWNLIVLENLFRDRKIEFYSLHGLKIDHCMWSFCDSSQSV